MKLFSKIYGKGEPLIIMHGVFGSGDNWGTLGRKWGEEFEVHLLDMRNHGKSPHSDKFSYDIMSDDLLEYMKDHSIDSACIIGHSMGGKVGMLFSVLNPARVRKLVVADIAPKSYQPHHENILKALNSLDLKNIDSRNEAEEQFAQHLEDEGTRMFLLKSLYWKEKGQLDWRFNLPVIEREITKVGDALPANAIYNGDTLFVRGSRSWYIKDEDKDSILEHFPRARIATIEGAGHWLHAEKPKEFYDLADQFLSEG